MQAPAATTTDIDASTPGTSETARAGTHRFLIWRRSLMLVAPPTSRTPILALPLGPFDRHGSSVPAPEACAGGATAASRRACTGACSPQGAPRTDARTRGAP